MNRAISILVHGSAKTGKSTFAVTAPAPRLLLDAEAGSRFLPIRAKKWIPTEPVPEVDDTWDTAIVTVRSYDDVLAAYKVLQTGRHPFASVTLDSVSELQMKLIDTISDRRALEKRDWGEVLRKFMGTMRDFRDLTEHPIKPLTAVIMVAMTSPGPNGKYVPFAQGQSRTTLPYCWDIIGAMHVQTWTDDQGDHAIHRLLIGANDLYETGERVGGRLGGFLDNPTIPMVLDRIFGPIPVLETASKKK